jgi:UDPglucose 6-dehydrogenase
LDLKRLKKALTRPVIIDSRNIYEPERMAELGFEYVGVGRGTNPYTIIHENPDPRV